MTPTRPRVRSRPRPRPRVRSASLTLLLLVGMAGMLSVLSACGESGSKPPAEKATTNSDGAVNSSTTTESGPPPGAELEGLRHLDTGQCFETTENPESSNRAVWVVDCAGPHTYEVYDLIDYTGEGSGSGAPYPGVPTVQDRAEQACYDRFESFVGVRWTVSDLDIRAWWPSEDSWRRNDRGVICAVMPTNGTKVVGSQLGVGR